MAAKTQYTKEFREKVVEEYRKGNLTHYRKMGEDLYNKVFKPAIYRRHFHKNMLNVLILAWKLLLIEKKLLYLQR